MKLQIFLLNIVLWFSWQNSWSNSNGEFIQIPYSASVLIKNHNNGDKLLKVLLLTSWRNIAEIYEMTYPALRAALVDELSNRSVHSRSFFENISDDELVCATLAYRFLSKANIKSPLELSQMTVDDFRNSIINFNRDKGKGSLGDLRSMNNTELLRYTYNWWLPKQFRPYIKNLNEGVTDKVFFGLKDNHGATMDVLRVVGTDEGEYNYLGVYHSMVSRNHFKLFLAGSSDLRTWTRITVLGNREHQGDIEKWGDGFIVVNEEDKTEGANNIKVRYYASYADLCLNRPNKGISLSQTLSTYAEGTPDIRKIVGDKPNDSHLLIGFHYYDNGIVDKQAIGILKNFEEWRSLKDVIANRNIIAMGYSGNIGGRAVFSHRGNDYMLLESQMVKHDFSSWRLLLGDGVFYTTLALKTAKKATSFANPGVATIRPNVLAVTSFLPSEGNHKDEVGELLYVIDLDRKN